MSKTKLTETERNIGQEILDAVSEIKAGGGRRIQTHYGGVLEAEAQAALHR